MLLCSCGGVILLKICNLELQFLKKQIFLKGKYSVHEITILSYFRIVLLSLLTPSYKMCNPPTKKKKGGSGDLRLERSRVLPKPE